MRQREPLSDHLEELPELQRLNLLVARHGIGVNDVFSYRKELYNGGTMNEIHLALTDNGGDLQAAIVWSPRQLFPIVPKSGTGPT